jgi:hypothetical protein
MAGDPTIFRQAALDRLASPERLDERLALPVYPRMLLAVAVALGAALALFAAWLSALA